MHRLTLFYKIVHSLTPLYLRQACTIIPHNTDNYQLRRNNSFLLPIIKKEIFSKSYFPKTIRDWNNLSNDIKQSLTLTESKTKIENMYEPLKVNKLFSHGHGWPKINHCRLRLGLSHLKKHFYNYNLINSPYCENNDCLRLQETPAHCFLFCPKYHSQRRRMLTRISDLCFPGFNCNMVITIMPDHLCNILLEGSSDLSLSENRTVFKLIFDFIKETGRFMLHDDDFAPDVSIDA